MEWQQGRERRLDFSAAPSGSLPTRRSMEQVASEFSKGKSWKSNNWKCVFIKLKLYFLLVLT
jgi:hypothetical protein